MGFNLGAFAAGFATQAQNIEEESAKIGMELIKEAIDDFREESKDWKSKYNTELREWETLAGRVKDMVKDDSKAIAVLRKGKPYALDFAKTAVQVAKDKGFASPADLVDFGESTLPKNVNVIDWVRSGAPEMALTAKPVLDKSQFEGMKTGVFGRQIYPEGMGRIERTKETYLDQPTGEASKLAIPEATFEDIYSTREVPGPMSRTDEAAYKKEALSILRTRSSALAGLNFALDGTPNYEDIDASAAATAEKHAQQIVMKIKDMRKSATSLETAPGLDSVAFLANGLADGFDNFYDIKPKDLSKTPPPPPPAQGGGAGAQPATTQPTQQTPQASGTLKSVTPQIANNPKIANLVTLPSNWQSMGLPKGKGVRRKAIAQELINLGVDPTVANQYSQNVTLN
jgi:hypothetical protein